MHHNFYKKIDFMALFKISKLVSNICYYNVIELVGNICYNKVA